MTTRQEAARDLAAYLMGRTTKYVDVELTLLALVAAEPGEANEITPGIDGLLVRLTMLDPVGAAGREAMRQAKAAFAAERERANKAEADAEEWRKECNRQGDRADNAGAELKSALIYKDEYLAADLAMGDGPSTKNTLAGNIKALIAERDALKATVERVRELLRASPSYTLSRAQIEGALAPVASEGQSEPVYVVLTNDRNSPNQVFVEIETASGESVRIDGGAYPDDPNLWRIGPLYRAPALDVEAAARHLFATQHANYALQSNVTFDSAPDWLHDNLRDTARAILAAATRTK